MSESRGTKKENFYLYKSEIDYIKDYAEKIL